jgi:hypothetical protein
METAQLNESLRTALENDPMEKAWLGKNEILFANSEEHADIFLTTYRFRNAYEQLLNRLEVKQEVTEEKDLVLVKRWFDMMFYPEKKLSLSAWKEGVDPEVRIVTAYKEIRNRKHAKRPFEISILLSDGNTVQINPADVLNQYFQIRKNYLSLENSTL